MQPINRLSSLLFDGPNPPGWNVNPSAWPERLGVLGLAVTGLGISIYLGMYQVGICRSVWEPYFANGSEVVLKGSMHFLGIPDAWVGASVYLLDVVFGSIGGKQRWRTQPWAILIQGLITLGLAVVAVLLTILQRLCLESYCTLCLASAACSILTVGWVAAEVLAALQHLKRIKHQGGDVSQAFWGRAGRSRPAAAAAATR